MVFLLWGPEIRAIGYRVKLIESQYQRIPNQSCQERECCWILLILLLFMRMLDIFVIGRPTLLEGPSLFSSSHLNLEALVPCANCLPLSIPCNITNPQDSNPKHPMILFGIAVFPCHPDNNLDVTIQSVPQTTAIPRTY
ncbi:hypothetical protein ACRALDRAFT_208099 [Sodiomyces alcalophilus JCM 7366]|uniref:uncharacterized protein n=1 Tax=Sodiomyces alcalophilus JCM 7366 TaxID=591952 RepID=UPI0039B5CCB0